MIEILSEFADTRDENAFLTGFIEFKTMKLYEKDELTPTGKDLYPETPCLIMEVLDEENSTAENKIMKPVSWVPITKKQISFFKKYMNKKVLEDEQRVV